MRDNVTVKRVGKTWAVFVDGKLVEGGFFSRGAAEGAADDIRSDRADTLSTF